MLTYRFILSKIFQICLSLSATVAFTQDNGQWVDDLYLTNCFSNSFRFSSIFIDENNKIQKIIPDIGLEKDFFKLYYGAFSDSNWHNGALYTTTSGNFTNSLNMEKNEDGSKLQNWTFAKWQDGKWHILGYYKIKSDKTEIKAIPCDDDRFIVIFSNNDGMGHENRLKTTPFYLMSIPSGKTELRIDHAIGHGKNPLHMADPDYFNIAYMSNIIMTDRHATLISEDTGIYWVFSLANASLIKTGNIFKEETAKMITTGGFANRPILCANPERKGTVLISAQDERFFTTETRNFSKEYTDLLLKHYRSMSNDDILKKLYFPIWKEFANRSPFIVWYRIYPETGEVEMMKGHPLGGSHFRDGMNDDWRPMPDGSVSIILPSTREALKADLEKLLRNKTANFHPELRWKVVRNLIQEKVENLRKNGIKDFFLSIFSVLFGIGAFIFLLFYARRRSKSRSTQTSS